MSDKDVARIPPLEGCEFDAKIGAWRDGAGVYYCMRCWSLQLRSPMKTKEHSHQCMVCGLSYDDPSRPPPPYEPPRSVWG